MLKLYKQVPSGILYWETWEDGRSHVMHWGLVGDRGEQSETNDIKSVEHEIAMRRADGYSERENLPQLVLQYRLEGWGNTVDIDRRDRIEGLMNEALGWTGLGHCDGGDIGSGTINVFCFVVDAQLGLACILEALNGTGELEGLVVAERRDEDYRVVHPAGHVGKFSPF
jgi:hypothetical protein